MVCATILAGAAPGWAETDATAVPAINLSELDKVPAVAESIPETTDAVEQTMLPDRFDGAEPEATDFEAESPEADYDTLSEAVADQSVSGDLDAELTCLAIGVYFESKGEPLSGQLAVADVILNRSKSPRFPQSICAVLKQRSQFSFVRGGRLPSVNTSSRAWRTAVAVAKVARADLWDSPASEALFFHANYVSPNWRLAKVATVGNHIFYR